VSIEVEGGQLWKCKKCGVETNGNPIICGVNGIEVDMDKERRVDAVLPQIAARVCYLLEGAEWLDAFVEEHALFPQSPWNDRVDALSQALEHYKDGPFYVL
jgi:predicted phage terminase large subunit-like protein